MPFFDEVCQEHQLLFVILRVVVTKLQTHIVQNCTKRTFTSRTFEKIRFKVIVIDTNCTKMSFREAVKGHTIPCFYGVSPLGHTNLILCCSGQITFQTGSVGRLNNDNDSRVIPGCYLCVDEDRMLQR